LIRTITFKTIWDSVRVQKKDFWRTNVLGVAAALLLLPIPILIPLLIDEILLGHPGRMSATVRMLIGEVPVWGVIALTLGVVFGLRLGGYVLGNYQIFFAQRIIQKSAFTLRHTLLHHLEHISLAEYETLKSGTIASKTVYDVERISSFIGMAVTHALTSIVMLIGITVVMFFISWPLALMVILINPLFLGFSRLLGHKIGELLRRQHEAYDGYYDLLDETLELFVQVRASNQERSFFGLLRHRAQDIRVASLDYGYRSSVAQSSSALLTHSIVDLFRILGIGVVAYTDLSIGMMLGFLFYLSTMVSPVQQLMNLAMTLQSIKPAITRLNHLLSLEHEPHYPHHRDPFADSVTASLELKNVDFAYTPDKPVLRHISLRAAAGEKIALIGPSGGGKTTLAHLMVGFYPPQKGQISYGNVPIEQIGLPVVRENVALMLQQSLFFNDTIRMNLTLEKNIDESAIIEALRGAQLEGFVLGLSEGLDTLIGKNGIRLSGGQRQRLAIARLILSDPKIIIFDEATSALDNDTEHRLYDTLEPFLEGRTVIIIAHRTTTIRQADRIYLIEGGEICAEGTYEELLHAGKIREDFDRESQ